MTKKIDDGGPAFPQHDLSGYGFGPSERGTHGDGPEDFGTRRYTVEGMSLRDHFAAQAIPAIIERCGADHRMPHETITDYFARKAYEVADAMIIARKAGEA